MTDLAAWLLEQIAEDEAKARGVLTQRWDALSFHDEARDDIAHIVRWSPVRVLAECAAKRAIVEEVGRVRILRILAQPYRDRPGWRDEWA